MLRKNYKIIATTFLLCFLIAYTAMASEVLLKVHSLNKAKISETEGSVIRFCGRDFLLVQVDKSQLGNLSLPYVVLDEVKPNSVYYLTRNGQIMARYIGQLEGFASILFRSEDTALLRVHQQDEQQLVELGLPLAILPASITPYSSIRNRMAPNVKSQAEMAADAEVIDKVIEAVNTNAIRDTIHDLQENRDMDSPHTAYRSRYSLRVKETDDPSDDACDNAAEYIYEKFESYGLDVEYDPFPHEVLTQGNYEMRNVVATLPGKGLHSDRVFIICAHYDSIALKDHNWTINWKTMDAPGANDNASGTAGVLEAARILSKYDFNYTIKFIAFSGEELRLHGSLHYSKLAAEIKEDIAGVLNLDMIAYDPDLLDIDIVANEASEWLVEAMMSIQRKYKIGPLVLNKFVDPEFVYSDHAPFWTHGWSAILAIDNHDFDSPEFYPFMHTGEDTIDKLDFDLANRIIKIATGTLASLADPMGGLLHPDMEVTESDISLSPENPRHGELVQVAARIHNIGEVDVTDVLANICLVDPGGATDIVTEELVDVTAKSHVSISASIKLEEWGNYRIIVKTNPDYGIFETNGSNNIASRNIQVSSESLALGKLILYPNPLISNADDKVNIEYTLSKNASTRLDIYSISGELVYQKQFINGSPGGIFGLNDGIEWDGKNLVGRNVSSGVYFCYLVATDENESISISKKLAIIK